MDNGEEIPGLNEDWNFLGAKAMEWLAGFGMFIVVSELFFKGNLGEGVPFLLATWVLTTVTLANIRRRFPDEERGVANLFLLSLGFAPPSLPTPAVLQDRWSGLPVRSLDEHKEFVQLGLHDIFPSHVEPED